MTSFPVQRCLGAVLALLAGAPSPGAQAPGPFESGLRWSRAPSAGEPWLPRSAAFAGEELLWVGAGGSEARVMLLASASDDPGGTLLFEDAGDLDDLVGPPLVCTGGDADELFALVQLEDAGGPERRTLVRRYAARDAARGAAFRPRWEHELFPRVNGPALLASGAGTLACAVLDAAHASVALEWLAPDSGAARARRVLGGDGLKALALSADGARLALLAGTRVHWLERDGTPLLERALPAATPALSLSADGAWLAHGERERVQLWHDTPRGPELARSVDGAAHELPVLLALAPGGERLAIAWWDSLGGVRLELLDVASGARLLEYSQDGRAGGPQNFPSALCLDGRGRRVALGLWGQEDARPELVLLEPGRAQPLLAADLAGSVEALALDASGTRLCALEREGHANSFSRFGTVRLLETGERELVLLAAARPGGALALALRLGVAQATARFAVAPLRTAPLRLCAGELWLERGGPRGVFGGTAVGTERVDALQLIPADPALIGLPLGVQAAWLEAAGARLSAPIRLQLL